MDDFSITGNTFIGSISGFTSTDFPTNDYSYIGTDPTVNVIVVLPNDYESNRCNILVYNWENLTTVDVDISSARCRRNADQRDELAGLFRDARLSTGTYAGGTINLPMTGTDGSAVIGDAWTTADDVHAAGHRRPRRSRRSS